jgi:hypothetical protein
MERSSYAISGNRNQVNVESNGISTKNIGLAIIWLMVYTGFIIVNFTGNIKPATNSEILAITSIIITCIYLSK